MNIAKFKDTRRTGDEFYNRYLKGKYAYLVHMRYAVPLEHITPEQYVKFENDVNTLLKDPDIRVWDVQDKNHLAWIDLEATDKVNSIHKFLQENQFAPTSDLTLEEIKKFRTWLASTLLEMDQDSSGIQQLLLFDESFSRVMEYYAGGMYDDTVRDLSEISASVSNTNNPAVTCGCAGVSDWAALETYYKGNAGRAISVQLCDALALYRKHRYLQMVEKFRDLDFWSQMPESFLSEFQAYIDNILKTGLPLGPTQTGDTLYADCSALAAGSTLQMANAQILRDLSTVLNYMLTDQLEGHKNFASDTFYRWSSQLYELMEW